jgi:nucleoside-diphosphate-sugar epimerase
VNLSGALAFVTGGTGFIGGRLIESLTSDYGVKVRVLVRGTEVGPGAFRCARHGVEFVEASITDSDALEKGMSGADFVFHCAFGSHGSIGEQSRITVGGTNALLKAASKVKTISRFVNLSTATVFGNRREESIDETMSVRPPKDWPYAKDKWEAEKLVVRSSVPTVTIRLPSIYGPNGPAFTIMPLNEIKGNRVALVNDGSGLMNAVFVDDAVQAMLLAATNAGALGETFLINGPDRCSRREFYECYERMLGVNDRLIGLSQSEIQAKRLRQRWAALRLLPGAALRSLTQDKEFKSVFRASPFSRIYTQLQKRSASAKIIVSGVPAVENCLPLILPPDFMIEYFASPTYFDDTKARQILGYRPRFDLASGMMTTYHWAQWAGLLD